jgi:hypothetical protein
MSLHRSRLFQDELSQRNFLPLLDIPFVLIFW